MGSALDGLLGNGPLRCDPVCAQLHRLDNQNIRVLTDIQNNWKQMFDTVYALLALQSLARHKEHFSRPGINKKCFQIIGKSLGWASLVFRFFTGAGARSRWFTKDEARLANQQRNQLLNTLSDKLHYTAGGNKAFTGALSPGCLICQNGDWECNFINRLCTRNCYFCKRYHRSFKKEPYPQTRAHTFVNPVQHIEYLKAFHIRGVGFSGGEPLLVSERLVSHISAIRQEFGKSMYLWMYTNGDLVNREILEKLQEAGLDEIRFNIAAREYDISPVILARDYIPTLTVEIPAIPEDYETVKNLLPELQSNGVDFLNLHQITIGKQNCRELIKRNYHLISCLSAATIFESEICALNLIQYACEQELRLPISYCSTIYKYRFQGRGRRKQKASAVIKSYQEITNAGYIRVLEIADSVENNKRLIQRMESENRDHSLWKLNRKETSLAIHSSLLPYLDWSSAKLNIFYFESSSIPKNLYVDSTEGIPKAKLKKVMVVRGWKQATFEYWRKLYIDNANDESVFNLFLDSAQVEGKDIFRIQNEAIQVRALAKYEKLDEGIPEVY